MADNSPLTPVRNGRPASKPLASLPIAEIQEAVDKVRHGTVQLIIQDGHIVQIDTLEKKRLV